MSVELRSNGDGTGIHLSGYPSVFNSGYSVRQGSDVFTERVQRGAFTQTLAQPGLDVQLLINHSGLPLARTTSGTLRLAEDAHGLRMDATLDPADPDVAAVVPKLRRNDLSEMSFAFRVTRDSWSENRTQRAIQAVDLHRGDVSLVSYGASPATSVALRRGSVEYELRRIPLHLDLRDDTAMCNRCNGDGVITIRCPTCRGGVGAVGDDDDGESEERAYSAVELAQLAKAGKAFINPDGHASFPIDSALDLGNAIKAVGRAPARLRPAIRKYIMGRARAMHSQAVIPATWNGDGTLKPSSTRTISRAEIELRRMAEARRRAPLTPTARWLADEQVRSWVSAERARYRKDAR